MTDVPEGWVPTDAECFEIGKVARRTFNITGGRNEGVTQAGRVILESVRAYIASLNMPKDDDKWGPMLPLVMESCAIVAERGWTPPRQPLYLADIWDQPPNRRKGGG
jgi:hypothetical protein